MNEIFHRTSIRAFEDKSVEQEKVEEILRAGFQAPSAANQQPWNFYVVENKELLQKLTKVSPYAGPAGKAPMAIVVAYNEESRMPEYNEIDCAIATESMMLEADSLGLGSVMLGIAPVPERMQAVNELVGIPEGQQAFTILPIGYPVSVKAQQDRYNEEKVTYLK